VVLKRLKHGMTRNIYIRIYEMKQRLLFCIAAIGIAIFSYGAKVAETPLFEFHSSFWVNLHHFVRGKARQEIYERSQSRPQSQRSPTDVAWTEAVNFYMQDLANRDLLFDKTMPPIKDALEDAEDSPNLSNAKINADLKKILEAAAPAYSAKFWKEHDESNRKWISDVSPLALKYGAPIAKRIAKLYKTEWFKKPVRVDLTQTAGPVGAYTSVDDVTGQPRSTISSYDPAIHGYQALEILFHESSHAWGKMLFDSLDKAATQAHVTLPRQFWHLVLFYTAGEVTRQELNRAGIKDYETYADQNGIYESVCHSCREVISREWQPYIDGKIDFDTAIQRVVAAMRSAQAPAERRPSGRPAVGFKPTAHNAGVNAGAPLAFTLQLLAS